MQINKINSIALVGLRKSDRIHCQPLITGYKHKPVDYLKSYQYKVHSTKGSQLNYFA